MLKAIIFDLDGVICSTDEYHYQAWKALADELGIPFDRMTNNRLRGVSRMESLEIILSCGENKNFSPEEKMVMAERKNTLYRKLLGNMTTEDLTDEVKTTLLRLRAKGLLLAIGSSSKNTPFILERLGLADFFDAIADGNCIVHSKPNPEVFLLAAKKLNIAPEEALVVEDALSGAEAGHRGGFQVACVGDASRAGAGEYNMKTFSDLLDIAASSEVL